LNRRNEAEECGGECGDRLVIEGLEKAQEKEIRRNTYPARPTGRTDFIKKLETLLGRHLKRKKPGRKNGNI